jgi:hypothetical protein
MIAQIRVVGCVPPNERPDASPSFRFTSGPVDSVYQKKLVWGKPLRANKTSSSPFAELVGDNFFDPAQIDSFSR